MNCYSVGAVPKVWGSPSPGLEDILLGDLSSIVFGDIMYGTQYRVRFYPPFWV